MPKYSRISWGPGCREGVNDRTQYRRTLACNEKTGSILMSAPVSTNVFCVRRCNEDRAGQRMKNRSTSSVGAIKSGTVRSPDADHNTAIEAELTTPPSYRQK